MVSENSWFEEVEKRVRDFARKYRHVYSKTQRELYAAFEIGCYLALLRKYERDRFELQVQNLSSDETFRFLTTPSGNPENFSFVTCRQASSEVQVRQQVRVVSHIDPDIAFTPDLVVLKAQTEVSGTKMDDYANGKKRFFSVSAGDVVSAHECKSLQPFPELLVSFIGMLVAAHPWLDLSDFRSVVSEDGGHLAPTLFLGGNARPIHRRMIKAMCAVYPMNVVQGLHSGTWDLDNSETTEIDIGKILDRA